LRTWTGLGRLRIGHSGCFRGFDFRFLIAC